MLPNFLIIGAMKCGTTTLHYLLKDHPDIYFPSIKEIHFFTKGVEWSKGLKWYESLFDGCNSKKAIGEASTSYTKYPFQNDSAYKIYSIIPNVKLIYIMRNPIERTWSHYWHSVRNDGVSNPPKNAITRNSRYIVISKYYMQIMQYMKYFNEKQFLFLFLDELKNNPIECIQRICDFLNISGDYIPVGVKTIKNEATEKLIDKKALVWLRNIFIFQFLTSMSPIWLKNKLSRPLKRKVNKPITIPFDLKQKIIDYIKDDVLLLENFLDKDLSEWLI